MVSKSCIGLGLTAWLLAAGMAVAQDQGATGKPDAPKSGVPEAPVGHRQPRASDVPTNVQKTEADLRQEKQNREFDRKLRICRNC